MCCSVTAREVPNQSAVPTGMCCLECSACAGSAQSERGSVPCKGRVTIAASKEKPSLLAIWIPVLMSSHSASRFLAELCFTQHGCLRPVPSLCPCSPCAHQHELCRSLLSLTAPPFLSCAYIVQTLPSDEGAPLWWSLSHPTPLRWWCSPELLVNAGLQGGPGMSIWHGSACPPCSADTSPQCKPVLPAW